MVTLFVVVALMLGGGAVVGYTLLNQQPAAIAQETIPSLAGMSKDDAMFRLDALGMDASSTEEFSAVDKGTVIRTYPAAGTLTELGTAVEVFISKGPSEVAIPKDVAGRTDGDVRQNLVDLGLLVKSSDLVNDGSIGANLVVTTDPAPGESVPVGTSVTIKVSTGQVAMPSLFDLTKEPDQVKKAVTDALKNVSEHLEVTFEESENSVVTPGMVTGQSIEAGALVAQRTTVVVTLAKAPPEPTPTPTPTPSETKSPKAKTVPTDSAPAKPPKKP